MASIVFCVTLLETFTRALTGAVREYCLREYFVASCPSVGHVILMTSALYGRMRIGRCIRGTFNIGCSNDVTALFDDRCSGRASCNVSVRSLVDSRPCQRDFASYLEASYRCVSVYDLRVTSCPTSRVADVTAVDSSLLGYISNTVGPTHGPCGRRSCPWVVRGVAGQRVQVSVVVLGHLRYQGNCPSIIVAEPADDHAYHDVIERQTFNVCSTVARQRHLHTTSGHVLVAYTSTNRSGQGQSQDLGQDHDVAAGRRFLLMYKIVGCPRLSLADGAYFRHVEGSDDVIVACNGTQDTWYLSCRENRWIGHFDNCSTAAAHGNYDVADINTMFHNSETYKLYFNNGGIALALCLGLLLGIAIAVLTVTTLCCSRRFLCRRRRVDGTDVRVTSRDRAVTSRKQVRREDGVLSNLTASCCQGRRRDGDTWRQRTGPQLMSVWDSGTTDCLCGDHPYGERLRDVSPTVLVDDPGNVVCWHHRHHHHHHHPRLHLDLVESQQQPMSDADDRQGCSTTPVSALSVRELPLECQRHRSRPRMTF